MNELAANFQPTSDRILVLMRSKDKTPGGIVLPHNSILRQDDMGFVVSVGPGRLGKRGKRIPMSIQRGTLVKIPSRGGLEVRIDGQPYVILREADVEVMMEAAA